MKRERYSICVALFPGGIRVSGEERQAGVLLRTSTRPALNRGTDSARLYEPSPRKQSCGHVQNNYGAQGESLVPPYTRGHVSLRACPISVRQLVLNEPTARRQETEAVQVEHTVEWCRLTLFYQRWKRLELCKRLKLKYDELLSISTCGATTPRRSTPCRC